MTLTALMPAPTTTVTDLGHERVIMVTGERSGLTIIVAVHSTRLGQALGGCRIWQYEDWQHALDDALRLSAAMTLKNAAAGLARGGGKAVIHIPRGTTLTEQGREAAMLDLGDVVESAGGSYMTAEDVGTSAELMAIVALRTAYVCGLPEAAGGVGEPADATARGVRAAIDATLTELFDSPDAAGRHAVIVGLGNVGSRVARSLAASGARLSVTDVDPRKRAIAEELGASWVEPEAALDVAADLLVPCGLGGILTASSVPRLRVAGVVGAANNQLDRRETARLLLQRGILWAPDFIANAGGVIHLDAASRTDADAAVIAERLDGIGDTITAVFREAAETGSTTLVAAERIARARLEAGPPEGA